MKYLEVDSRGRVSLGDMAKADRYLVEQDEDGTIRLIPTIVLTMDKYTAMMDAINGRSDEVRGQ